MLHGRERELARISAVLDAARDGRSGALLLVGEPGIGKTALLDHAAAGADGLQVLRTRGFESERDIPFAGLHGLLAPVLELRSRIPDVQARALGTALAVEAPAPHDAFAVPAAVLSLLGAASEEGPLLALVDDVQWLDDGSLRAIVFAARRLGAEGVAVLLATRADPDLGPAVAGIERLEVARLGDDAARAVVAEHSGSLPGAVVDEVLRTAGGNPLALRKLPAAVSEREGASHVPSIAPGASLEQAFRDRFAGLDEDVRRALAVVGAMESGPVTMCLAALERLDLGLEQIEVAESVGLLRLERGEVDFAHPLLRSLAYHSATGMTRLAAHRALADVATDVSVRAWHLSNATAGPDEETASVLDAAADEARRRGAPSQAAAAAARAAELSSDDTAALGRRLAAGADLLGAGRADAALVQVDAAARLGGSGEQAAALRALRAQVEISRGNVAEGRELLVAEAERRSVSDPLGAAGLFIAAGGADLVRGESHAMVDDAERAAALALEAGAPEVAGVAALVRAVALAPLGHADEATAILTEVDPVLRRLEAVPEAADIVSFAAQVSVWLDRYDVADGIATRQIEAARSASAVGRLTFPLTVRSNLDFRRGRWDRARCDASEAVALARETGQLPQVANALAALARVEAGRGEIDEARAHALESDEITDAIGGGPLRIYARTARGFAELAAGRFDDAIVQLLVAEAAQRALGGAEPAILQFDGDLLEALVRADRRNEALEHLERLERQSEAVGRAWGHAVASRTRAMLASDEDFGDWFARAFEWHERSGQPFETARTRLAFGERLRRAGQRTERREELRRAVETFERLGAAPWVTRAQAELRASGQTLRARRSDDAAEELTPGELQVALRVAEGLTNREVAAAIFLSPKTVEYHLSAIYRKLGIRSRTELARHMAEQREEVAA